MIDEYLNPSPCVDLQVPAVIAPEPAALTVWKKLTMILKLHTWIIIPMLIFQFQNLVLKNPLLRPVSTRHQLQDEAIFYYFDDFLSSVEPKSYKEALTESCWIEAMQEELNEFEHLEVWELAKPTEKHLHAVKRIFRYLRGTINMGLWYLKDSCIALTAFVDVDKAGCQDTRK
nr:uncharacterized mitochondrial protein AtMg00810-like [Tanacetum cinerariifolium]GFB21323.1 uncharacterized mitochondrial protein AtMg00810-like [Tanacetum cinerariifolium]